MMTCGFRRVAAVVFSALVVQATPAAAQASLQLPL